MKNRIDNTLLVVSALTLPLHFFIVLTYFEVIPIFDHWSWPYWAQVWHACLAVGFSALPAFCLQLFLCRRKRRWLAALPALILVVAVLWFTHGYFTASGWDTLGWWFLLILSIAPAVGLALGWAVYGGWKQYRKGGHIRNAD